MNESRFQRVSVVGLGYIGLPTAATLASRGIDVVGVDTNDRVVEMVSSGEVHIVEPGLQELVKKVVLEGKLTVTSVPKNADAFIIAVPTPLVPGTRQPDLSFIRAATKSIANVLEKDNLVILESTSPPGTTSLVAKWLAERRPDLDLPVLGGDCADVYLAYCPERVIPGKALQELIQNDRVIGGMTSACSRAAVQLYEAFVEGECVIAESSALAEMVKLTENSYRDVNIAFANELSIICDDMDLDVHRLIELANLHPRVEILKPGAGVGGHCIAVDPWFIVSSSPHNARMIRQARETNDAKPDWVVRQVQKTLKEINSGKSNKPVTVACWGLAFKPDVDDLRESPALQVVSKILELPGVRVVVIEPHIDELPIGLCDSELVSSMDALEAAEIHVILVTHTEFLGVRWPSDAYVLDIVGALA